MTRLPEYVRSLHPPRKPKPFHASIHVQSLHPPRKPKNFFTLFTLFTVNKNIDSIRPPPKIIHGRRQCSRY